jgi:hypothetical protein
VITSVLFSPSIVINGHLLRLLLKPIQGLARICLPIANHELNALSDQVLVLDDSPVKYFFQFELPTDEASVFVNTILELFKHLTLVTSGKLEALIRTFQLQLLG